MDAMDLGDALAVTGACRGLHAPTNPRVLVRAAVALLEAQEVGAAAIVVLWLRALVGSEKGAEPEGGASEANAGAPQQTQAS